MEHDRLTMLPPSSPYSQISRPHPIEGIVRVSKNAIIDLLNRIPFDDVSVRRGLINDQEESATVFLEDMDKALIKTFDQ
jgi:hypothetical protein